MFRKITATILLLAFVAQTFASPFILLDYFVNTSAYAPKCINKSRPKMHCNGQCQAMKKILEIEKKEQQNSGRKSENKFQVFSSKTFFCAVILTYGLIQNNFLQQNINCRCDRSLAVFHPPQA